MYINIVLDNLCEKLLHKKLLSEAAIFSYLPPDHSVNGHVNRGILVYINIVLDNLSQETRLLSEAVKISCERTC